MRFLHLADLHIGKKVNGFSMLEDQRYVLEQVLRVAEKERLDGVLLAGDIYDKTVPAGEAVQVLDWFLTELSALELPIYMVSGNHDSGERLSFAAAMLKKNGVHIASIYNGALEPIEVKDEYGILNLYMLPFVKPVHVRKALMRDGEEAIQEDEIRTYDDAVARVLSEAKVDPSARNLLVAHQLVTGAARCDSEDVTVGGIDNVNAELFDAFDYVALGHIHGPQSMTRQEVRYAGTLLKYSFSECNHKKSMTIVELKEKGDVSVELIPVRPLRDMRILKGHYAELMSQSAYEGTDCQDYLKVILTDEKEIPEVMGKLRTVYPNIMALEYDNVKSRSSSLIHSVKAVEQKQPMEYFRELYEQQNGKDMDGEQEKIVLDMMREIWGE